MQREPLDAGRIRAALGAGWGCVEVVDETASTNADLVADVAAPDRSVRVAELQVAGRGRLDRGWSSPPRAGLTFSVLLRPAAPVAQWGWLPLLTGVALHEAVVAQTGVGSVLKWPNDLLAAGDERKLAGILAQTAGDAVVVGVGLNVDTTAAELPVDTATSLALCGARDTDRATLLVAILDRLAVRYEQWGRRGLDAGLLAAYRQACGTLGRRVRVSLGSGAGEVGEALDVDGTGRLLLRTERGEVAIAAGDVEHLRPA